MVSRPSNLSIQQRQEMVLRLLRGEVKEDELASEYSISEAMVCKLRDQFIEGGMARLDGQASQEARQREYERELAKRDQVIGELTVAKRILEKIGRGSSDTPTEEVK